MPKTLLQHSAPLALFQPQTTGPRQASKAEVKPRVELRSDFNSVPPPAAGGARSTARLSLPEAPPAESRRRNPRRRRTGPGHPWQICLGIVDSRSNAPPGEPLELRLLAGAVIAYVSVGR